MNVNYNLLKMVLPVCFFVMSFGYAQNKTVSGTITSKADGQALPGVSVIIKGTTTGVSSDFDGKYSISVGESDILQFSYLGFATLELAVSGLTTLNVQMAEDSSLLEEVVVTG